MPGSDAIYTWLTETDTSIEFPCSYDTVQKKSWE